MTVADATPLGGASLSRKRVLQVLLLLVGAAFTLGLYPLVTSLLHPGGVSRGDQMILGIYFPKTMYWTGKGGPRFIRPIRWSRIHMSKSAPTLKFVRPSTMRQRKRGKTPA